MVSLFHGKSQTKMDVITGGIPISGNHQFLGIRQDESQEGDLGLLRFGVADVIPRVPTE